MRKAIKNIALTGTVGLAGLLGGCDSREKYEGTIGGYKVVAEESPRGNELRIFDRSGKITVYAIDIESDGHFEKVNIYAPLESDSALKIYSIDDYDKIFSDIKERDLQDKAKGY